MAAESPTRDTGVGLAIVLSLLAIGGALGMYLSPDDPIAGWAFAVAVLAGSLAVVALHAYQ
ncbi:MAG: hypothetical protein ABEI39_00120 [Halobacteriales archaeon]